VGRTSPTIAVYKMFPKTLTVASGTAVAFTMAGEFRSEVHTVTFGPEKVRADVEKNFLEPLPAVGAGALGLNPVGAYPSDQPPALPPYDGTNHGNGFLNTGLLDNDPSTPFPPEATITFTKAGTYDYECVIHEHMDGRIVVT
jgi:plastocyanin